MSEKGVEEFSEWCKSNDFADLKDKGNQLVCDGRVKLNKETGEVSGNLEAIDFQGKPQYRGDKIELKDSTWWDMDEGKSGEGTLTIEPKERAFSDMSPVKFTVRGWR